MSEEAAGSDQVKGRNRDRERGHECRKERSRTPKRDELKRDQRVMEKCTAESKRRQWCMDELEREQLRVDEVRWIYGRDKLTVIDLSLKAKHEN